MKTRIKKTQVYDDVIYKCQVIDFDPGWIFKWFFGIFVFVEWETIYWGEYENEGVKTLYLDCEWGADEAPESTTPSLDKAKRIIDRFIEVQKEIDRKRNENEKRWKDQKKNTTVKYIGYP